MSRYSRAELQARNRARVLAAAEAEFTEHGFRAAKVDRIADRAELTRGAVYSNFSGKRALYFAVLADRAERTPAPQDPVAGRTVREALGAFARARVSRPPFGDVDERPGYPGPGMDLMPEVLAAEPTRRAYAQLMQLDAILLGLALERIRPPDAPPVRMVRIAAAALTTLYGGGELAGAAPGFIDPYTLVSACEQLAGFEINDRWPPPAIVAPTQPVGRPWTPPGDVVDAVTGRPADLAAGGLVAVLGLHRLAAVEEAVRAAPPGAAVTVAAVTGDLDELAPVARLVITEVGACIRQAFPESAWPPVRIVCTDARAVAAAAGVSAVSDATETAVWVQDGRIVARAEGIGAGHAVASMAAVH